MEEQEQGQERTISIIIPTQGRHTLRRCLQSLSKDNQPKFKGEIIVVHDTYLEPNEDPNQYLDVMLLCSEFNVKYEPCNAKTHNWGYPQLERGYGIANGDYIMNAGDDDVYIQGGIDLVYETINFDVQAKIIRELRPYMFQAILHPSPHRGNIHPVTLWDLPRLKRQCVTGQNFICPNGSTAIGFWWDDFCQMEATINNYLEKGIETRWVSEVIVNCY